MASQDLVLIPGLLCTANLYAAQIAPLSAVARVQVAENTGAASMASMARLILAGAPPRFALCGLSMGGYLAFEIMRQAPERVTRLALLDTSAKPDTPDRSAGRFAMVAAAEANGLSTGAGDLLPLLVHPRRLTEAPLIERIVAMAAETGLTHFARQQQAIAGRADSRSLLPAIAVPTLVLVGREDRLTPLAEAEEIARGIAGSTLAVIEDCGHLSTMEQPEAVARALLSWLGA